MRTSGNKTERITIKSPIQILIDDARVATGLLKEAGFDPGFLKLSILRVQQHLEENGIQ